MCAQPWDGVINQCWGHVCKTALKLKSLTDRAVSFLLFARKTNPISPNQQWNFGIFCPDVGLLVSSMTTTFIKIFFAFSNKNNTLQSQKLCEQISVSLYNVLKLISLVQKENTATFAIKLEEKRNTPDPKMTWSEGTDAFPAAPLLAASAQQQSNFPWLLLSEAATFGPLWHREPWQSPWCARGLWAPGQWAHRDCTLTPVCPCTCRTQ